MLSSAVALCAATMLVPPMSGGAERKTCKAADGVTIVYSAAGSGEPALVFIHGAFANRGFWDAQIEAFAPQHRVVALDLPGHGESGSDRAQWGLPEFGDDVRAVVEAEGLQKMVLIGNSLGGPVAVEAALRLPGKVLGVVGIDTFHTLAVLPPEGTKQQGEAFRNDYAGAIKTMVKGLFHPDAPPELVADAEQRMLHTTPEVAYRIMVSIGGYDWSVPVSRLTVPLVAINADLYPTDLVSLRSSKPDFQAIEMKHVGHYPMIERPEELDAHVREVVGALVRHAADGKPLELVGSLAPPRARTAISLTPEQLDRCVGRYELGPGYVLTITREAGRLLGELPGQGVAELLAESESEFFLKDADMQFSFDIAGPGPAKAVTGHQGGHDVLAKRME